MEDKHRLRYKVCIWVRKDIWDKGGGGECISGECKESPFLFPPSHFPKYCGPSVAVTLNLVASVVSLLCRKNGLKMICFVLFLTFKNYRTTQPVIEILWSKCLH